MDLLVSMEITVYILLCNTFVVVYSCH